MNSNLPVSSSGDVCTRFYIRIKRMTSRQCWFALSVVIMVLSTITIVLTQKTDAHLSTKLKLVIDSDAGTDDAMALFLFLRAEKYAKLENNTNGPEILGITCVNGNTGVDNVVVNVLKVLQEVNRLDIPVYRGAEGSLLWTPSSLKKYGSDGMGDVPMSNPPSVELAQSEHAVNALIRLVDENPGEITVVALGPLTNIALAIRMEPDFLKKIKKLIIMGGSVEGRGNVVPGVEFNFYIDPEANYIVLNGTKIYKKSVMLLPWEAVLDTGVTMEWRKTFLADLNSPEIIFMNKIEHIENYEDDAVWKFSDTLTAAITLNETLIGSINSYGVNVVTEGPTRGGLAVDYSNILKSKYKIDIAYNVNMQEYQNTLLYYFS